MGIITNITTSIRGWFGYPTGYYPLMPTPFEVFSEGQNVPFIGPASSLHYTPVYRAVTLISNDIARTPVEFLSNNLEQIWNRPNRFQSGFDFVRQMTMQALLYGNSFALINRKRNGEIYELVPLPIGSVSLDVTSPTPQYITTDYGRLEADNILHIKASLLEGLWANSPVNLCKTAIIIGLNQENNVHKNAESGGLPNMAFVAQGALPVQARQAVVNDYLKNHTGKNAGKPIVLAENMKIEKLTSTSVAADLEQARKYTIADVSRIYGVPTAYLGETSGNVYGSLEWMGRAYLDSCLSHWLHTWAAEFELKLGEAPLFDTDFLVKPSLAESFAALRTGVEASIITRNEARAYLDFDPVEGGDEFIVAKNMGQGGGQTNLGTDTSDKVSQGDIANGTSPII
jgi:HK97 family phage portal protein